MKRVFSNSVFFLIVLVFSLQFSRIHADLPVHCLKHQIVGSWELSLTAAETSEPGVKVSCEHDSPDNPATSFLAMQNTFKAEKTLSLDLNQDDSVKEEGVSAKGSWTMIYDEGFEIRHKEVRYFAFSEYVKSGYGFQSKCSETLVGWYHNYASGEKGCFKGKKNDGTSALSQNVKQSYVVQPDYLQKKEEIKEKKVEIKAETESKPASKAVPHYSYSHSSHKFDLVNFKEMNFEQHKKITERLNKNVKKSWVAGVHHELHHLSLSQLNRRAGRRRYGSLFPEKTELNFNSFVEMDRSYANEPSDVSDLPKNFNWENYLEGTKSQGNCGSCYVFATVAMMQARLKINHNDNSLLSVQHSINCNFYNQGCDGGYPFLVEKFANEYGLVEESCAPYEEHNGKCNEDCSSGKRFFVKDYRFVGGSYGKSNEREMMLEIQKNGPIVVSFEPNYDFMYYTSGVYHSVPAAEWILNGEEKPEWEKVDHSVLCYGWGEEDGEKYWLLQNTWGSDWGENGNFRMRRGTDESHIESLAEAADPYVKSNSEVMFVSRQSRLFLNKNSFEY